MTRKLLYLSLCVNILTFHIYAGNNPAKRKIEPTLSITSTHKKRKILPRLDLTNIKSNFGKDKTEPKYTINPKHEKTIQKAKDLSLLLTKIRSLQIKSKNI